MYRPNAHRIRASGLLPAILLCLAAALAAAYGPLTNGTAFASSLPKPITGGMGASDQQSAPGTYERAFVVLEGRSGKATAFQHDGGSNAALLPREFRVPERVLEIRPDALAQKTCVRIGARGYRAHAPPALS